MKGAYCRQPRKKSIKRLKAKQKLAVGGGGPFVPPSRQSVVKCPYLDHECVFIGPTYSTIFKVYSLPSVPEIAICFGCGKSLQLFRESVRRVWGRLREALFYRHVLLLTFWRAQGQFRCTYDLFAFKNRHLLISRLRHCQNTSRFWLWRAQEGCSWAGTFSGVQNSMPLVSITSDVDSSYDVFIAFWKRFTSGR